jgi:hypothetical protein
MGRNRKSDFELPQRVYRRRGKLYYVAVDGRWSPLQRDVASDQAKHLHLVRATPDGKGFADLRNCFERIRRNARHREIVFNLTWDDVVMMWQRSRGRCEVSGIPFTFVKTGGFKNRPFAPSIDRINNGAGYSIENCRLVCVAVNAALNEWGMKTLLQVVAGVHKRRRILDGPK